MESWLYSTGVPAVTDAGAPFDAVGATAGPAARSSVARVGIATAVTAVCGYAVLYLAARKLEPAGFSVFGVFWGAFGLVTGAANGLLQEATREVRATLRHPPGPAPELRPRDWGLRDWGPSTRPMWIGAGVGLGAAIVIAGTAPLWSARVFADARPLSVTLLSLGLAGFCLHATLLGMLAGTDRWSQYGSLMVTDAGSGWSWPRPPSRWVGDWPASSGPPLPAHWPGCCCSPPRRGPARRPDCAPLGGLRHFCAGPRTIAAAGASAVLVMGFPVLLKATSGELGAAGAW